MSLRTRLKLATLALGVLLLGLAPYPCAYTSAMRRAESYHAIREYGAALAAYRQAADLDSRSPLPWLGMGQVLIEQHRFVEAAEAFGRAELLGADVEALLGQGESHAGRGNWASAIKTWLQVQALAPDDARVYVALARGAIAQGRFDNAVRYLVEALQLGPTPDRAATAHALLGRLLIDSDAAQAETHLRHAGDDDMLSVLATADGEADPARRALLLGTAFLQRDELSLARHYFERAVTLAPNSAEAHAYLAHILDRQGETIAAREELERALALDAESVPAHYFLGVHHRQVGNAKQARAALWEALLRDSENAALRVEMAEAFVDLGDYEGAEEWYQGAVEAAPDDIEFALLLTHFYLDHLYRVEEGGLPAAMAAVTLAPADARAHDLLGWAYYLAGDQAPSHQALSQALDLDPDLVSAHYHLGSLYASTGQYELARKHLQRAADLDIGGYYRERARILLKGLE